jgi:hypothetical protein
MKKIMAKWVPHLLDERQQKQRCEAAYRNLQLLSQHPRLLRQTLALDETWVVLYRPPEGDQYRFWLCTGEEPPQVPKQKMHERKRMLLVAMDFDGIAYYHLYEEGETVNAERYRDFLSRIIPDFRARRNIQHVMLFHDLTKLGSFLSFCWKTKFHLGIVRPIVLISARQTSTVLAL